MTTALTRSRAALLAALLAAAVLAAPVAASTTTATGEPALPLHWHVDPDAAGPIAVGDVVDRSSSTLFRSADGIDFEIETTGLVEGHGYTVWFFAFNNPEACLHGSGGPVARCETHIDLFFNPAAGGSADVGPQRQVRRR